MAKITDDTMNAIFIPTGASEVDLACAAYLASLADSSPEAKALGEASIRKVGLMLIPDEAELISPTRAQPLCGVNLDAHKIRIGTVESISAWLAEMGGSLHEHIQPLVDQIVHRGDMAVVVACESIDLGVISLSRSVA